jgi:O-antigen ligase
VQYVTGTFTSDYGGFAHADIRHIVGETNEYRISGPLSSNYYALVLVVLVPLALDRVWHEKRLALRLLAIWALAVTTLSIVFTFSRGGFIALLVVFFLMLVRIRPRPSVILVTLGLGLLLLPFVPEQYGDRLRTLVTYLPAVGSGEQIEEGAIRGRLSEITVAWRVFSDNPIGGIGYQNFETQYLDYSPQLGLDPRREDRGAHSLYLEVAAETGIVGSIVFGVLLVTLLTTLFVGYRAFHTLGQAELADLSVAMAIGLVGFFTASLFLHSSYPLYFWLFVGIVLAIPNVIRTERASSGAGTAHNPVRKSADV